MLVSSHVLAEVAQTVDAVVIMHRGHLVATLGHEVLDESELSLEELYLELTTRRTP